MFDECAEIAESMMKRIKEINEMDYEKMFRLWRFSPRGSPYFQGTVGEYFLKALARKRDAISVDEYTRISKKIGW